MDGKVTKTPILLGISLVGFSMLAFEVTLTRIFSVTVWYHFAFMCISIAMLGISVSGVVLYLLSEKFPRGRTVRLLALNSLLFSISIIISYLVVSNVRLSLSLSLHGLLSIFLIHTAIAIPFFFGGLTVGLALTHMATQVGRLYFSDLVGASLGCLLVVPIYSFLSAPSVVVLVAVTASLAALCFAGLLRDEQLIGVALVAAVAMALLLVSNAKWNFLRIKYSKAGSTEKVLFEKWNSFSRVSAVPFKVGDRPFGWGLSRARSWDKPAEIMVGVDASAGTPITHFDGDRRKIEYMKYDVTALAHYLVEAGKVLIIGPGGGRDVLTALAFDQREIVGVEINPIMVELVNDVFGDFSGRLYQQPNVKIVIDEGRSYISRSEEKFDLIQASMVDTWAASAAGAFTLMENNLYTREAFSEYLEHLTEKGILTMSRWYVAIQPGETLRMVSLGVAALRETGVEHPERHIIVAKNVGWLKGGGVATMLIKRSPFTNAEIRRIRDVCKELGFGMVVTPAEVNDARFAALFENPNPGPFFKRYPIDISPPVDDRPFFFHMLRLKDFYRSDVLQGSLNFGENAISVLVKCLLVVFFLNVLFIFAPLLTLRRTSLKKEHDRFRYLLYFACLGLAFMLVEIPTIQRFTLFLGHPVYSLSVALFALLFFSGVGSLCTDTFSLSDSRKRLVKILGALSVLLIVYVFAVPPIFYRLIALPNHARIAVSVALLCPLGLLMGMPFPLGLKLLNCRTDELVPWCWAVNGATSVLASVLAIAISISYGFGATLLSGLVVYLLAMGLIARRGATA
ncbi:MAG: hypothetical protein JSV16_15165 [Candidatus Hydrogenedentota bacterium]|nr:MAG: hypothetical protein JSV16_15165 [Candidatus Hydrogenedentota bacterium]